jgi:hypothetical protein
MSDQTWRTISIYFVDERLHCLFSATVDQSVYFKAWKQAGRSDQVHQRRCDFGTVAGQYKLLLHTIPTFLALDPLYVTHYVCNKRKTT